MAAKKLCNRQGCRTLIDKGQRYCDIHKKQDQKQRDQRRGTAHERGYTYKWNRYSKVFLTNPENVFCKLHLPGCTNLSECVDHIDPPDGPNDPRFWDTSNHQGACIHCNSVKGHTKLEGKAKPFESIMK